MAPFEHREDELVFTFPDGLLKEKLDEQGKRIPIGMSLADLVIHTDTCTYIIELKDPSCSTATVERRNADLQALQGDDLIKNRLTPKARDSYTYLHLMDHINPRVIYIVLLGLENVEPLNNKPFLNNYKQRLLNNIRHEADEPWKREYILDCIVCNVETWNEQFPQWPTQRRPIIGAI